MTMSLAQLLRPLALETFLRDAWDRAPWHAKKSVDEAAATRLLDLRALERIVGALYRPGDGWLQLARGGRRGLPDGMVREDGLLDMRALYAAFAQGETLYLTKAERLAPPLMELCRAVELELAAHGVALRQPVNAHVFLTPPGSQGFPPHRDEHASIVIQLEGAKAWRVYDRTTEHAALRAVPTRPGAVDREALGAEVRTFALEAGDVLYVPEGWAHEAEAHDEHSLHVTLRLFALRWCDVMQAIVAQHAALAGPLPRHALRAPDALADALGARLGEETFRGPLAAMLGELARARAVPSRVLPDDGLRQVLVTELIHLDTELVPRRGASCEVTVDGAHATIAFPGGSVRGPAAMAPVFRFVAQATRLRPRDLPAMASEDGRYNRLDVARTLVRDGLLRVAFADDGGAP